MFQDKVYNLYDDQLKNWELFNKNIAQLDQIKFNEFNFGNYIIKSQYNPSRVHSSNAKLDKKSISNRKCFLCKENRPSEQKGLEISDNFTILVNPFPILRYHFTIPINKHCDQEILPHINEMIDYTGI